MSKNLVPLILVLYVIFLADFKILAENDIKTGPPWKDGLPEEQDSVVCPLKTKHLCEEAEHGFEYIQICKGDLEWVPMFKSGNFQVWISSLHVSLKLLVWAVHHHYMNEMGKLTSGIGWQSVECPLVTIGYWFKPTLTLQFLIICQKGECFYHFDHSL